MTLVTSEVDPLVLLDDRGYATGSILIPDHAKVSEDAYDKKTNIHTVMFSFDMQHCLYKIDYNLNKIMSFGKDYNFEWINFDEFPLSYYI